MQMAEKEIKLCTPCMMALRRRGRRIRAVPARREKITCWYCDKRRYGQGYLLEDSKCTF